MAPGAQLYSLALSTILGPWGSSDAFLQETVARTNALISNNSWYYVGDHDYSVAAASYDMAVRDSLPGELRSEP